MTSVKLQTGKKGNTGNEGASEDGPGSPSNPSPKTAQGFPSDPSRNPSHDKPDYRKAALYPARVLSTGDNARSYDISTAPPHDSVRDVAKVGNALDWAFRNGYVDGQSAGEAFAHIIDQALTVEDGGMYHDRLKFGPRL